MTRILLAVLAFLISAGEAPADDANTCLGWERRSIPADSAVAACDRLISSGKLKGTELAKAFNERGLAWRRKGDLDLAIADYGEAIRHDPKLGDAYNNRGVAWIRKGDNERAIADLDNALRLAQDKTIKARAYQNRGSAHHANKNFDLAIQDYSQAIGLDPKYAMAFNNRGASFESKGDLNSALADYRAAGRLAPEIQVVAQNIKRLEERLAAGAGTPSPGSAVAVVPPRQADPASVAASPPQPQSVPPAAATPAGRRIALVIGNGKYQHAVALPNPASDARAVAKALGEIGFEVALGTDLDRAGMEGRLRDFLAKASSAQVALLFYAGHGLQVDGRNYLVPVDAKLETASDLNFGTVDLDRILASLEDPARANIVILDACRDNPLARSFAAKTRSTAVGAGLAAYTSLGTGTLIAFSTAPGKVAADGDGANSPFTQGLIKYLHTPGLEVRQMLTRVRNDVAKATGERQVPWDNSSLRGDVYLAGLTTAGPANVATPSAASVEPPRAISVDEFRRELVGKPLCGRANTGPLAGKAFCTTYHSDGTAVITGPGVDARGVWEADGGQICRQGADGKRLCLDYVRLGPDRFRNSTGIEFCIGPCP
jgi:tetratricopeptide (TPR) repeat protein